MALSCGRVKSLGDVVSATSCYRAHAGPDEAFIVTGLDGTTHEEETPMARPKKVVQPSDLGVRKTHAQVVVVVTSGTLVFVAGMTSRGKVDALPVHPRR